MPAFFYTELNVGESCDTFTDQCIEGTTCDDGTQTCRKYCPQAAIGGMRVEEFIIICTIFVDDWSFNIKNQ